MNFPLSKWAARVLLPAASLVLVSCAGPLTQQRLAVSQIKSPQEETIVGLTTVKGEDVEFDLAPAASGKIAGRTGGVYESGAIHGLVKGSQYLIPIAEVQRLWVMRHGISTGRTVALVGVLGGAAIAIAVAVAVANRPPPQPTQGSCPFIYSWDGQQFVFDSELFGGAVSRGMQRDDYSELSHLRAQRGSYRLLLADELPETDYTDRLELWTVDHPEGSRVAVDDNGKLYSLGAPQAPLSARDENNGDLLPWLGATDRRIWEPPPAASPDGPLRHEIVLTFPRPAGSSSAKLLVHAGTGEWGLRMFTSLFELYGQDLDRKLTSLDSSPTDVMALKLWSVRDDLYALKVWVEEPNGWQVRGIIPGGGMGARVVPLDVSRVRGDQLRIRLEPPAGFWAINSTAIDFSPEQKLEVNRVAPQSARTGAGHDVLAELQATDGRYYKAVKDDSAAIAFAAPAPRPGMHRTVFLHSSGYYRPDVRSQGPPDTEALRQIFETPDGLARFAARRYAAWRVAAVPGT